MPRTYCVYFLTNWKRVLYIGVTSDLPRRLHQHLSGEGSTFAKQYRLRRLVYVEVHNRAIDAIQREKQLKGWTRARKLELIASFNPRWDDLAAQWGWRPALASSAGERNEAGHESA